MWFYNNTIMLNSHIGLACVGMLLGTGCGTGGEDRVDSSQVALEIRFQDDNAAMQPPSADLLSFAAAAPGPATHDTVARILVDITFAESGQPFFLNFDLAKLAPDVWRGDVPLLPRSQPLRFAARALGASGEVAFSGETLATLSVDNQSLEVPLAPAQNNQTFQIPRMFRIVYPAEVFAGQEEQVAFTILGNAGATIGLQIAASASPTTPSADFSPATGTVALTNTVADFMTVYTPPDVTADTDFDYQVTITDARAQSAVAITTNFRTHIKPRPPGGPIARHTQPSVLFNPVILSLTANGSETPGTVELVAAVSDDSAPDKLAFQWSYAPNPGTPAATFANNGQGDPGLFEGYTVAHQGTITLAVTDEHNGTTTLHYPLTPDQFADAIDHASVNGLKRIVAGDAHTCVLTGQNQVRCWGDNQFGQLGYGNTINVGDAPSRLPYTAGDVPLPVDPVMHLPLDPVMQLVAGNNHTCVLLQSGLVYCWGDNRFGQLGYNRTDNLGDGEPVTSFGYVTLGDQATRIAAGGDHTCAILQGGALRCWGRNDFGQLGRGNIANIGDNETVFSAGNVDLGTGVTVKDLALGGFHTCALLTTGAVRCWGFNNLGQLGYGSNANLGDNEPINDLPDVSLTGPVRKLVAGTSHTCALTFAGTLRCWGDCQFGQLGQSFGGSDAFWGNQANELPSNLPGDVNTGAQITDVTAGDHHTCALSSDGQLKCWGLGSSGQLNYGTFNNLGTPPVAGVDLDGVTAYRVTAGAAHTCALRSNGTARCWGSGADGRLGRGSTATSPTATGNVDIQILAPRNTVGGTVGGLDTDESVTLQNNGTNNLTVSANGSFTFTTPIASGSTYAVTVLTNPPGRTCTVTHGLGTVAGGNVTNVTVSCSTSRSFAISPAVNGKTSWNLETDGSLVLGSPGTWTLTANSAFAATARAWGAGGAGGNPSRSEISNGGGGGFASGTINLETGDSIVIVVGGGGSASGAGGYGGGGASDSTYGGGGGRSSITIGGLDQIVGGGGGGGGYDYAGAAAGGATGSRNPGDGGGGGGGAQTAGGAGSGAFPGNPGTFHQGGDATYFGGGGGGGYYGGAGGGTTLGYGNGGGGGSSYVGGSRVTNGSTTGGSAATPGGVGDPDYGGGAGEGGAGTTTSTSTSGNPGRVVIVGSGEHHTDPSFSSVVLLLHMDGADGSTTFTDVKGHAVTPAGNAKISTTTSKFGGASGYFDGTGDYVSTTASADFDFNGTEPFTIEAWVNGTGTFWSNDWYGMMLSIKNGTELRLWIVDVLPWDFEGTVAGVVTAGWHHVALSYDGTTYRVFVDGAQSFSVDGTMSEQTFPQGVIGSYVEGTEPFFNGYLDEIRVTKGVARYTASFTPPATQFDDN